MLAVACATPRVAPTAQPPIAALPPAPRGQNPAGIERLIRVRVLVDDAYAARVGEASALVAHVKAMIDGASGVFAHDARIAVRVSAVERWPRRSDARATLEDILGELERAPVDPRREELVLALVDSDQQKWTDRFDAMSAARPLGRHLVIHGLQPTVREQAITLTHALGHVLGAVHVRDSNARTLVMREEPAAEQIALDNDNIALIRIGAQGLGTARPDQWAPVALHLMEEMEKRRDAFDARDLEAKLAVLADLVISHPVVPTRDASAALHDANERVAAALLGPSAAERDAAFAEALTLAKLVDADAAAVQGSPLERELVTLATLAARDWRLTFAEDVIDRLPSTGASSGANVPPADRLRSEVRQLRARYAVPRGMAAEAERALVNESQLFAKFAAKNDPRAAELLGAMTREHGDVPAVLLARCQLLRARDAKGADHDSAMRACTKAIELDDNAAYARVLLAILVLDEKERDSATRARVLLEQAIARDPDDANTWRFLADVLAQLGDVGAKDKLAAQYRARFGAEMPTNTHP